MPNQPIYMPHPGHFICAKNCRFFLNTYINGYIVSTVGEMVPDSIVRAIYRKSRGRETTLQGDAEEREFGFEEIGCDRLYETMVFKAKKSKHRCCPWEMCGGDNLDFNGYNNAVKAYRGHLKMVNKYQRKKRP